MTGIPGAFYQQSVMFHSSVADQGDNNESSTGSSLQELALLTALMEKSCCICFDMPEDGALIPSGHRMCKDVRRR